jgi:hypothetical protein
MAMGCTLHGGECGSFSLYAVWIGATALVWPSVIVFGWWGIAAAKTYVRRFGHRAV